ncbi:hypothetical protein [Mucilaginibacter xinganensis]|uniref:Uncharacterized protein n=1 Tax=Mucilaginibacter xinganensis TaxID=1234841 RepID=A0A223NV39_9SPHI|nr:hypothetical protein [Mucilaginibacter xinganensis]ASU33544.1 hypothetical protein MuYL_1646 [Mucilaginibacter xinganensis]
MNAIVPLNVAAARVNQNDNNKVVGNFQGKTTMFEKMPWNDGTGSYSKSASTGDKIFRQLGTAPGGNPLYSPLNQLGTGIHLHWELPDYFKKGSQTDESSAFVFPNAPNRWLVTRYLSIYNQQTSAYDAVTSKSWVVESDYISSTKPDSRPAVTVPLPATPSPGQQPYMYMGRVVDFASWNPATEPASSYLPYYNGIDGQQLYLTSIGFVGAYFSSYYPECCSVFGFWDNFSDVSDVYTAITTEQSPIQFKATYQVIGWLDDPSADPLASITAQVTTQYNQYVSNCTANNTDPVLTPVDFFNTITTQDLKWTFNLADISYTLGNDYQVETLNVPTQTLCAGTVQEVVWNMNANLGTTYFLSSGDSNPSVWSAPTEVAIGNSTEEALSALLKYDMGQTTNDPDITDNYELLLDALQLGLLNDIEKTPNKLIELEEALHQNGFSSLAGGYVWMIADMSEKDSTSAQDEEITLPLELAEQLYLLNKAQKDYDMGRGGLSIMRKQLFMDWIRYVKLYMGETTESYISSSAMSSFIWTSSGGELNAVVNYGNSVGLLQYTLDDVSQAVNGIMQPGSTISTSSLAYAVWTSYQTVLSAVVQYNNANPKANVVLQCGKAPDFYLPQEPVVLMEGDMIEPPQRNGDGDTTYARLSQELLSQLQFSYSAASFTVNATDLANVPVLTTNMPAPLQPDVQTLIGEAFLITPMLAPFVTTALAAKGGSNNPAVASAGDFTTSLMYAQGGLSPLDITPNPGGIPAPPAASLFATVYATGYTRASNVNIAVTAPQALQVTFTNAANDGWVPDNIGWNTQLLYPEFTSTRVDPFLPIFMIWNVSLNPLLWEGDNANQVYSPTNLTDFFSLDADGVDYLYNMNGSTAVDFTSPDAVDYSDDATMRTGATNVLSYQITNFINNNPNSPDKAALQQISALYSNRKILSQGLSSFNINQILATFIPQIAVENLVAGAKDSITSKVAAAAKATLNDNWYDDAFSSLEPISSQLKAQGNFGPLRAGFMDIISIELVDVFGQRMDLTSGNVPGMLSCITSYAMSPQVTDTANQGKIYLAPRIETPTRLWFKWLSAQHNSLVPGVTADFVEMNSHPSTSPVCGWVIPNHLDNDLFFYDFNGTAIGTFGIEHVNNPVTVYRTRAGNLANPTNSLAADIGEPGSPTVNEHLANYMWYINSQPAAFLEDMMTAIQNAANFISPSNFAQDVSLSVLIGSPLALTRSIIGMETLGNLLPLSQADTGASSPFPQDVNNARYNYTDRMPYSSANLGSVQFPVRLGDLANLDDGLVGFLFEGTGSNPYSGQSFYTPAAKSGWTNGVEQPTATTLQLTLNETPVSITMLIDPRAAVHATTGVLGVSELGIPADQYASIMNNLAVNFTTRPMLQMSSGLVVPLPAENGYSWSWITPGASAVTPLAANAANQAPAYGYSPQRLLEGWLALNPDGTGGNS